MFATKASKNTSNPIKHTKEFAYAGSFLFGENISSHIADVNIKPIERRK